MLSAAELKTLLVTILAGATDGNEGRWRDLLGTPTLFPPATHPSSNWTFHPEGTVDDRNAVAAAIELVREQHPLVAR